jgi:bifunctional non-homologous end joining protein LigD
LEGIVSKRADAPYASGNRGLWVKVKCLNREEFVIVGWTDPEGTRPWLGSLLGESENLFETREWACMRTVRPV